MAKRIRPPICLVCKNPVVSGEAYRMVPIDWIKYPDEEERFAVADNFKFHLHCFENSTKKSRENLIKAHYIALL